MSCPSPLDSPILLLRPRSNKLFHGFFMTMGGLADQAPHLRSRSHSAHGSRIETSAWEKRGLGKGTVAADAEWTMSQTAYCTTLQHFAAPRSGFEGAAASIPTSDRCGPRGAGRQSTRSSACLVGVTPAASRQDSDESPDGPRSPRLGGARVSAHPSRGSGPRLGYGPGPETSATTTAPPARPPAAAAAGGGGAEMFRCRGSAGRPHEGNPLIG